VPVAARAAPEKTTRIAPKTAGLTSRDFQSNLYIFPYPHTFAERVTLSFLKLCYIVYVEAANRVFIDFSDQ
jgi:hypothetical protein